MQLKKAMAIAVLFGAIGGLTGAANAQNSHSEFRNMLKMDQMDMNKDGMVSKKEFMAAMEKAWDMKAKEMKAKDSKMTEAQMQDFWQDFNSAGS